MKKGKLIFFILILLTLIIGGTVIIVKNVTKKINEYSIEKIDKYSYFKLYKDEKYGVMDDKGNILINPEYNLVNIPNPSKAVFVCYYDQDKTTGEYKVKVLNEKNEQLFTNYEQVLPLTCEKSTTKIPFEKSVLQYKKDGKYGIMDFYGEKITDAKYDEIKSLEYREGTLKVKVNDKYGLINIKGVEIINPEYDDIKSDQYYTKQNEYMDAGFILKSKIDDGYKFGYADKNGNIIINTEYSKLERATGIQNIENIYLIVSEKGKEGVLKNNQKLIELLFEKVEYNDQCNVFVVSKNSKQGVFSFEGKEILKLDYDSIICSNGRISAKKNNETEYYNNKGEKQESTFKNIIATSNEDYSITIDKDDKFGVINKNGQKVIENQYSNIEYAFGKYFIATQNDKVGVIDANNKIAIDFSYDIIQKIKDKNILQAIISSSNTVEIYNNDMKKQVTVNKIIVYSFDTYLKIASEDDVKYFDNNGNLITNKEIFVNNSLLAYNKDGKWGFVDKNGNIVIEPQYDLVTELNQYGFAGIKKDNLWGVIDYTGKIIVSPIYKINGNDPDFINKYYKTNIGFGFEYYTEELK